MLCVTFAFETCIAHLMCYENIRLWLEPMFNELDEQRVCSEFGAKLPHLVISLIRSLRGLSAILQNDHRDSRPICRRGKLPGRATCKSRGAVQEVVKAVKDTQMIGCMPS